MLTFFSTSLGKEIEFAAVDQLSVEDMETFHTELVEIVKALAQVSADAKGKAEASGVPVDVNWLHRVHTKKRIALKFANEVNSRLQGGTTVQQRIKYDQLYKAAYRDVLLDEFGPDAFEELEDDVLTIARKRYQDWIHETKQTMWFVP
jgi:hypothetical protein